MQIIVVGAGAIGSLYGAKLAAGHEVVLLGRPEHVCAVNAHGLQLEGLEQASIRLPAVERLERIESNALLLLTTKVFDTAAALTPIASLVRDDTTIVSLQNGLGSEEIARSVLQGKGVVLRGITQLGAIFESPGRVRYMVRGQTLLEEHERAPRIVAALNAAGLDCQVSTNIRMEVWRKLIFNCVINPITSILGCAVGGIANPALRPLKQMVVDECLAVARVEGLSLANDFMQEIDALYGTSPNTVSMRQDLERGRRTEIDYLNGAVADLGERHELKCPVNRALTALIKAMETTKRSLVPEKMLEPQPG